MLKYCTSKSFTMKEHLFQLFTNSGSSNKNSREQQQKRPGPIFFLNTCLSGIIVCLGKRASFQNILKSIMTSFFLHDNVTDSVTVTLFVLVIPISFGENEVPKPSCTILSVSFFPEKGLGIRKGILAQ